MFSPVQYRVTGRNLLSIFPNKPRSSREMQYNQTYIFNELDKVNSLRNRIAHHETICFASHTSEIDTSYVITIYTKIKTLFSWMDIDSNSVLRLTFPPCVPPFLPMHPDLNRLPHSCNAERSERAFAPSASDRRPMQNQPPQRALCPSARYHSLRASA